MPDDKNKKPLHENTALLHEVMLLINKRLREKNYISEEFYRKTNEFLIP